MKSSWSLQDAKNRFSEVVDQALNEGPQTITRRGKETAVLVSIDTFRGWTGAEGSLTEFLRRSPLKGVELR